MVVKLVVLNRIPKVWSTFLEISKIQKMEGKWEGASMVRSRPSCQGLKCFIPKVLQTLRIRARTTSFTSIFWIFEISKYFSKFRKMMVRVVVLDRIPKVWSTFLKSRKSKKWRGNYILQTLGIREQNPWVSLPFFILENSFFSYFNPPFPLLPSAPSSLRTLAYKLGPSSARSTSQKSSGRPGWTLSF